MFLLWIMCMLHGLLKFPEYGVSRIVDFLFQLGSVGIRCGFIVKASINYVKPKSQIN